VKLNLTELTLDVIAQEVRRAVQEERERCLRICEISYGEELHVLVEEKWLVRKIKSGWNPNETQTKGSV
jgi:hypothetical protein